MRHVPSLITAILLSGLAGRADAQNPAYEPLRQLPRGPEVIALYIGSSGCGGSQDAELKAAIRAMKPLLAEHARATDRSFSVIGVALDWSVDAGTAYLDTLGPFDEIVAGRHWVNSAAIDHIWRDPSGWPGIPQVVLLERMVDVQRRSIRVGPDSVIARYRGPSEIIRWVDEGAPIPERF
ncbi:MAG: hypothetical protein OEO20_14260 [Gemmatimonadota bacterium]|nr:hypothetical protein [Gemmatimonadota bacterium]MDH3368206.1 hypothetical protein [Gemmatimonadota bacterium]MDH3479456.1 hypothetical protein [Gemmatimonadota bacterium]MDH5551335.1 hypothetical protein [Gemmatimonadota bacterium]